MLDTDGGSSDRSQFEEVLKIKEQANAKVKEGDYFSAKCLYSGALELLERCCLHLSKADEAWEGIKNNVALCDLRRSEWTRVVETTTEVLHRNPSSTKALYRRALAYVGQERLQDAMKDLKSLVQLEPSNVEARQRLQEVQTKLREARDADRDQAAKIRGFLRGEHLNDTVPISPDGAVRKLHGNENRPLLGSWIKREWLSREGRTHAVVTCHIVMKTQTGQEVFSTRRPSATMAAATGEAQQQPARPARFVLDDSYGNVFAAWNVAVKSMEVNEVGRFELAKHTLGPSVETAIRQCMDRWMAGMSEMGSDLPEEVKYTAKRQQALQVLCLPEVLCPETFADPTSSVSMEVELLEVNEFHDLYGDGRCLLRWLKKPEAGEPAVAELSHVKAHFRLAKLLLDVSLKDSKVGLVQTCDGLVVREDDGKPPVPFVVGEKDDFVPPCVSRCLLLPSDGVTAGAELEFIMREGVPFSETDQSVQSAFAEGLMANMPDTTGPVLIRIAVAEVEASSASPPEK